MPADNPLYGRILIIASRWQGSHHLRINTTVNGIHTETAAVAEGHPDFAKSGENIPVTGANAHLCLESQTSALGFKSIHLILVEIFKIVRLRNSIAVRRFHHIVISATSETIDADARAYYNGGTEFQEGIEIPEIIRTAG